MSASQSPVVLDAVVSIHAQEAISLAETRLTQLGLPHINIHALARLDERLAAHFDGLAVAGLDGQRMLDAESEAPSIGSAFAAAVNAIEAGEPVALEKFWNSSSENRSVLLGLIGAFGWVDRRHLQGIVRDLLRSPNPAKRAAGLAACAAHQVNPGLETGPWLEDSTPAVRAMALQAVGELGLRGLEPRCARAASDEVLDCAFSATWSAVLLGDRGRSLDALARTALAVESPTRESALRLALQAMSPSTAHTTLQRLGGKPEELRWLIRGSGINGDPSYVTWLVHHMADERLARLAGEAFTLITGADLDAFQLWRARPENFESGPTDNPDDESVDMDLDEGLMWPDPEKVAQWWESNGGRFQPGTRYFMGAPVARTHCVEILKTGYQRQRILAAHYLCLLDPGTPLFNTSAPAWRQQRALAAL